MKILNILVLHKLLLKFVNDRYLRYKLQKFIIFVNILVHSYIKN